MSEWVDFVVYAAVITLLFVFLPRHGTRLALPMIGDRNPQWLASHPAIAASVERSRWFVHACYGWAAVSITASLAVTLDLIGAPFSDETPKWEVLKDLHVSLLIIGMIGWAAGTLHWWRWLCTHVPPAEIRRATLKPRTADDYLARHWRFAVEALTVLNLGAWAVMRLLGFLDGDKFWGYLALLAGMSALFAVFSYRVPRRPPDYADRLFGEAFRRVEMRAVYTMRLWPLVISAIGVAEMITAIDFARTANLLISCLIVGLLLMFLSLRPVAPGSDSIRSDGAFFSEGRS
jgi:hypothetical protein